MAFFSKSKQNKIQQTDSIKQTQQLVHNIADLVQLEEYVNTLVQGLVTQFYNHELLSIPEVRASKKWFVDRQIYQLVILRLLSYTLTNLGLPYDSIEKILDLTLAEKENEKSPTNSQSLQLNLPLYLQTFKELRFTSDIELALYLTGRITDKFEELLRTKELTIKKLQATIARNPDKKEI